MSFTPNKDFMRRLEELGSKTHQVAIPDLFPDAFMQKHTQWESAQAMVDASPWADDADALKLFLTDQAGPPGDRFVAEHTDFQTFSEMRTAAAHEWTARQLGAR